MNERSAPASAIVCPFVAFEDDRDRRSPQPDHRHRCFAEPVPAPRALAHQQHYCLSASFATCPTFADWAQREAAREAEPEEPQSGSTMGGGDALDAPRAMARDWAAPPPWVESRATDGEQLGAFDASEDAGEREQRTPSREPGPLPAARFPDADAADIYAPDRPIGRRAGLPADTVSNRNAPREESAAFEDGVPEEEASGAMPAFLAGRLGGGRSPAVQPPADEDGAERPRRMARSVGAGDEAVPVRIQRGPSQARPVLASRHERREPPAPAWERSRRAEAYPTLRTRVGLPEIPRLAMAVIALVVAAAVLFFLPTLLANPGTAPGTLAPPSANPSAAATGTLAPSTPAAPTPTVYTVVPGDTLSGIATKFGLTVSDILAANPQIKDPNKIAVGDQITIPPKPTPVSVAPGGSALPSGSSLP